MEKRRWVRSGGMSAISDDGRRIARGHRYFTAYERNGKGLSIPVENLYEGGVREEANFRSVFLIGPEIFWFDGNRLSEDEIREMKEDLADAMPVLGSQAVFISSEDEVV